MVVRVVRTNAPKSSVPDLKPAYSHLFKLPIGLGRVEDYLALEVHALGHRVCNVLDANFRALIDRERDGVRRVVLPHDPDRQLGKVERIDELPKRRAAPPDGEGRVILLRVVALVNESRYDMPVLDGEIVVRTVDVRGDDAREVAPVLFGVGAVHRVDEALGVCVPLVGRVRRAVVKHGLVDGICRLVREDARREHGNELRHLVDAAVLHDVVVYQRVLAVKFDLSGRSVWTNDFVSSRAIESWAPTVSVFCFCACHRAVMRIGTLTPTWTHPNAVPGHPLHVLVRAILHVSNRGRKPEVGTKAGIVSPPSRAICCACST